MMVPGMAMTGPPPAGIFMSPHHQLIPQMTLPDGSILHPGLNPHLPCVQELPSPVPSTISQGTPHTPSPQSLKRKATILPSPEESPEGPYIGQHSQGIGGHYADSYWPRKRAKRF